MAAKRLPLILSSQNTSPGRKDLHKSPNVYAKLHFLLETFKYVADLPLETAMKYR